MSALKKIAAFLVSSLISPLIWIGSASATAFLVEIDTSLLSGDAIMAFDFNDSDTGSSHVLTISGFETDGNLDVVSATPIDDCSSFFPFPFTGAACQFPGGTVTGALGVGSGVVSISDAGASSTPITYYQMIDLGSVDPGPLATYIKFRFEMTPDATTDGATPDGFAFWLLNPGAAQDPESNPGGDLLGPGPLVLYTLGGQCDTSYSAPEPGATETAKCSQIEIPSVPEPGSMLLAAMALLALALARSSATDSLGRKVVRS